MQTGHPSQPQRLKLPKPREPGPGPFPARGSCLWECNFPFRKPSLSLSHLAFLSINCFLVSPLHPGVGLVQFFAREAENMDGTGGAQMGDRRGLAGCASPGARALLGAPREARAASGSQCGRLRGAVLRSQSECHLVTTGSQAPASLPTLSVTMAAFKALKPSGLRKQTHYLMRGQSSSRSRGQGGRGDWQGQRTPGCGDRGRQDGTEEGKVGPCEHTRERIRFLREEPELSEK